MKKTFLLIIIGILIFSTLNSFSQSNRIWATYYGWQDTDFGGCTTTDALGNVYMSGNTYSTSGIASGGFQNNFGGGLEDAFLVKFDIVGNRLWATYYGGSDNDEGNRVTTDIAGNVYLTGTTLSSSGIASGGYQNNPGGGTDAFLVKFDAAGNRLWATYFGGNGNEYGYDVRTDAQNNVFISGRTSSSSGIASGGFQNSYGGGSNDAFLAKFNSAGTLLWATYYGGSDDDLGSSVTIDAFGDAFLCGYSNSTSAIASGGFQNLPGGGYDGFLVKFSPSGNRIWATYYGWNGDDKAIGNAIDGSGNIYLCGFTNSYNGIASGGFQNTYGGGIYDGFLVKFSSFGVRLWATYYGGTAEDRSMEVETDTWNHVYLVGDTYSNNNIASNGFQNNLIGSENQFLVAFDSLGNRLCATFYGHQIEGYGNSLAVDGSNNLYLSGTSNSATGIASGGFQNTYGGGSNDAFLVKFSSCFNTLTVTSAAITFSCQDNCTGSATVTALGGTSPYSYNWNTIPPQTTQTADSLCAGTYTVTITDNTGSSASANVVISIDPLTIPIISVDSSTWSLHCNQNFVSYQWYDDSGTIINGATNQNYTPTQNGNYLVAVTDSNGCTSMSVKFGVHWLSIAEMNNENYILIFPNPANEEITVAINDPHNNGILSVYDMKGRKIIEQKCKDDNITIDISQLSSGIYFFGYISDDKNKFVKFIKV
jgi:hypothetical protein